MIPQQLQPDSQWVKLNRNNITQIYGHLNQLKNVSWIEISHNNLGVISSQSMQQLISTDNIEYIDISHNNMSHLPKTIKSAANSTVLQIGNNPYKCSCDMLWMANWLVDTNPAFIPDFRTAICTSGAKIGTKIYRLTESNLGCIPLPIALICGACVCVLVLVVCIFMFFRNLDIIKFQLFLRFNVRVNEDQAENVDEMNFDGLVAYK